MQNTHTLNAAPNNRINWIDFAKGLTIMLVVQMHVTAGIEAALNEHAMVMHSIVDFFRAFRMPLFFLVAGLFLHRSIHKPWMEYLDKKVIHFAYFYFLWIAITFVIKYPASDATTGQGFTALHLLWSIVEPFGTLWFIYLLAVFYVVTKLLKPFPMPVILALGLVAFLWQANPTISFLPNDHSIVIREFLWRYIFFLSGFYGYSLWFKLAEKAGDNPLIALSAFGAFAMGNMLILSYHLPSNHPLILLNSYAGVLSTIGICAVLARLNIGIFLSFIGKHSLFIYISFFVPNAFLRTAMIKLNLDPQIDLFILIVWSIALAAPIILYQLLKNTPLSFFYIRPKMATLSYYKGETVSVDKKQDVESISDQLINSARYQAILQK